MFEISKYFVGERYDNTYNLHQLLGVKRKEDLQHCNSAWQQPSGTRYCAE